MPFPDGWQIQPDGAGPFVSRIVHRLQDGSLHTWTSRRHRKSGGLQRAVPIKPPRALCAFVVQMLFLDQSFRCRRTPSTTMVLASSLLAGLMTICTSGVSVSDRDRAYR